MEVLNDITVIQLRDRLASHDVVLLDVREPIERASYHIGGLFVPLGSLPNHLDKIPKDKEVVIYCRSGKRSHTAKEYLITKGYHRVRNLLGGMLDWQRLSIEGEGES